MQKFEELPSFFHFFTNLKTPSEEEIKTLDIEVERDLGVHFDYEYEILLEFVEDIIPYSTQYLAGVQHDQEEYHEYSIEQSREK